MCFVLCFDHPLYSCHYVYSICMLQFVAHSAEHVLAYSNSIAKYTSRYLLAFVFEYTCSPAHVPKATKSSRHAQSVMELYSAQTNTKEASLAVLTLVNPMHREFNVDLAEYIVR
jgi:hypothetical protein